MNWIEQAKRLFKAEKPAHFTDFTHCEECAEHDQTLLAADIDHIGLAELGNPGWDPLCFCHSAGLRHYLPALVRLALDTLDAEFYLGQLLFHLETQGMDQDLWRACTPEQRRFIAHFMEYLIAQHSEVIEYNGYADEVLRVHAIWSQRE
jgi:hypothetical protein